MHHHMDHAVAILRDGLVVDQNLEITRRQPQGRRPA
jgi:hypothetical protein